MYYVYIIQSKQGRYYIGSTENLEKRIAQHNSKSYRSWTNRFDDWKLIYYEKLDTRLEALRRLRDDVVCCHSWSRTSAMYIPMLLPPMPSRFLPPKRGHGVQNAG